jgi:hypothetical protein
MCLFNCKAGETIRIGDEVSLRIRAPEDRPILLAVEWSGDAKIPVEIVSSGDGDGAAGLRIVGLGIPA